MVTLSIGGLVRVLQDIPQNAKHLIDTTAILAVMGSWMNFFQAGLTIISTIAGLVWIGIRIYETETIKEWRKKRAEAKEKK